MSVMGEKGQVLQGGWKRGFRSSKVYLIWVKSGPNAIYPTGRRGFRFESLLGF